MSFSDDSVRKVHPRGLRDFWHEFALPSYNGVALGFKTKNALAQRGITLRNVLAMSDEELRAAGVHLSPASLAKLRASLPDTRVPGPGSY